MRIIAGSARGKQLKVPPKGTRPTSDRVREAMFSRLEHLDAIHDARVLDLYAGSGALGIEALSRGAASATFVEAHAKAAKVCLDNLKALGLETNARLELAKVKTFLAKASEGHTFHTVLADPPYEAKDAEEVVALLLNGWLAVDAVIMWEQPASDPPIAWPSPLRDLGAKTYGDTRINFAELPPESPEVPEEPGEVP